MPYFSLCRQDFESDSHTSFNAQNVKNINLALSLVENFFNSCNQINKEMAAVPRALLDKCT
jgi:hypothetical protein